MIQVTLLLALMSQTVEERLTKLEADHRSMEQRLNSLEMQFLNYEYAEDVAVFGKRDDCIYCPRVERELKASGVKYRTEIAPDDVAVPYVRYKGQTKTGFDAASIVAPKVRLASSNASDFSSGICNCPGCTCDGTVSGMAGLYSTRTYSTPMIYSSAPVYRSRSFKAKKKNRYYLPSYSLPSYSLPSYSLPSYSLPSYNYGTVTTFGTNCANGACL